MKEQKDVLGARSMQNGIVFYSNKNPAVCYEVLVDKDGQIKKAILSSELSESLDNSIKVKRHKKLEVYSKICIFILAILSIVITKNISIAFGLLYFSARVLNVLFEFAACCFEVKLGKSQSTGKFHAAEHKVINAYRKQGRIPTISEIEKASRFGKKCGSRYKIDEMANSTILAIIICLASFIDIYLYMILIFIQLLFSIFEKKYNFFRFFQIFITNKPTHKELEIALTGIQFFEEMEKELPE